MRPIRQLCYSEGCKVLKVFSATWKCNIMYLLHILIA